MNDFQVLEASELDYLPPARIDETQAENRDYLKRTGRRIIVVDDDLPGPNTIANASLISAWDTNDISWLLDQPGPVGIIQTNSRALPATVAAQVNEQVGRRLREAMDERGLRFDLVSRTDSALRGHFPAEIDALARGFNNAAVHGTILMPFYSELDRITVDGVHYVGDGDRYRPVGDTDYGKDTRFAYDTSDLAEWVEKRSRGSISASDVVTIGINALRLGGVGEIEAILTQNGPGRVYVVDAINDHDVGTLVAAIRRTNEAGMEWMYRAAPSLIRGLIGIAPAGLVKPPSNPSAFGGLVVVGSHSPLSSAQILDLLDSPWVTPLEANVIALVDEMTAGAEISRLVAEIDRAIIGGRIALVYTSRTPLPAPNRSTSRHLSSRIAMQLCRVITELDETPAFVVAVGGATAHLLATEALLGRRARVLGPLIANTPVWEMGRDTRYPGLPYVALPGNAGAPTTLSAVVSCLQNGSE